MLAAPVELACPCGHREPVPASAGGLTLECPRCGRQLMVPLAGPRGSETLADVAVVERLTGRKFTNTSEGAKALVPLTYLALLTVAPLAGLGAWLHWSNYWPAGAVYPLVGLFWATGIIIARWGVVCGR
ncbi:MAG: hypothetical protein KBG84_05765 [Planctomycetes bacterium]|nr:hypothetical protein [Planctomycetota bacterium]